MGRAVNIEQRRAGGMRGWHWTVSVSLPLSAFIHSSHSLEQEAGLDAADRARKTISSCLPWSSCLLSPKRVSSLQGRVEVALQMHWKRQESTVPESLDCKTYLPNTHQNLPDNPSSSYSRGTGWCPKTCPSATSTTQGTTMSQTVTNTAKPV